MSSNSINRKRLIRGNHAVFGKMWLAIPGIHPRRATMDISNGQEHDE